MWALYTCLNLDVSIRGDLRTVPAHEVAKLVGAARITNNKHQHSPRPLLNYADSKAAVTP
jgi:hypothetical protein